MKLFLFLKLLEFWTEFFGFFVQKTRAPLTTLFFKKIQDFLTNFFSEDCPPNKIGTITDICLAFRGVFFDSVVKREFKILCKNFMNWNIFLKVYSFAKGLGFGAKNLEKFCEKIQSKLSKLLSTCQKDSV